ncbi:DUF6933 domain-containing protein [Planococcus lenghuensis]|uniref:DUF6933 domain-containing protein n=1 Tax=Planococcus lenghuensis TaxID=2213202 RepID=A0A1Q2L0Q9_9BACL|nr:hypothetical protein [Planococcus lenghuensis]AQQ54045.1 hypothetical protein B0X71_13675 [Planococcus lenghuensis]
MMTIQCTKKMLDSMKVKPEPKPGDEQDALYAWHANLLMLQRRKFILLMNNKTRYNFLIGPVTKKEMAKFEKIMRQELAANLAADGTDEELIKAYLSRMDGVRFTKTSERSILGQLNESAFYIEAILDSGESVSLSDINRRLNEFVMLKLPLVYSGKTMIAELTGRFAGH